MTFNDADIWHMRSALNVARAGLGRCAPNPCVGCVIVKDNLVLSRARTDDRGRPHAETQAILNAGTDVKGATVYVTLEPCAHQGKTGPCAQALIEAGATRVIIGTLDPDDRVSGQGVSMLKSAGIRVDVGVLEEQCRALNSGYFLAREQNRPLITLKTASSLDSKIATSSGESKWITGEPARRYGHIERAQHDAILVGVNTVLSDKPSLSTRITGVDHDPFIVVLDTNLKLKNSLQALININKNKLVVLTCASVSDVETFLGDAVHAHQIDKNQDGRIDLNKAMACLCDLGITRVLVEGGGQVVTSFLKEELFDRLLSFRAPRLIGSRGLDAVQEMDISHLDKTINLTHRNGRILGDDTLDIYERSL